MALKASIGLYAIEAAILSVKAKRVLVHTR